MGLTFCYSENLLLLQLGNIYIHDVIDSAGCTSTSVATLSEPHGQKLQTSIRSIQEPIRSGLRKVRLPLAVPFSGTLKSQLSRKDACINSLPSVENPVDE